jgi:hypothetical protein
MSKIISIFFLITLSITGYGQIIRGTILDQNTHVKINFASVYFSGTFAGTHTDKNGFFEPLGISWHGEMSKQRTGDLLPFEYKPK